MPMQRMYKLCYWNRSCVYYEHIILHISGELISHFYSRFWDRWTKVQRKSKKRRKKKTPRIRFVLRGSCFAIISMCFLLSLRKFPLYILSDCLGLSIIFRISWWVFALDRLFYGDNSFALFYLWQNNKHLLKTSMELTHSVI